MNTKFQTNNRKFCLRCSDPAEITRLRWHRYSCQVEIGSAYFGSGRDESLAGDKARRLEQETRRRTSSFRPVRRCAMDTALDDRCTSTSARQRIQGVRQTTRFCLWVSFRGKRSPKRHAAARSIKHAGFGPSRQNRNEMVLELRAKKRKSPYASNTFYRGGQAAGGPNQLFVHASNLKTKPPHSMSPSLPLPRFLKILADALSLGALPLFAERRSSLQFAH